MIAVVTGSNGFIGSHLVEELLRQNFSVRCIDLQDSVRYVLHHPRMAYYQIDCADVDALLKTDVLENADYVFHLAGSTKDIHLDSFRRSNVLPTENILQVLVQKNIPIRRFVYASTQAVGGPAESLDHPVSESMTPSPVGYYAQSKLEGEEVVRRYRDRIPATILRPASVYGPRDVDFFNIFKQLKSRLCLYPANRDKYVSLLYVADLIKGMIQAAQSSHAKNQTYFLSSDDPVCWKEIYTSAVQIVNKKGITFSIPQAAVECFGKMGDLYGKITGHYSLVNSQKVLLSRPRYWVCTVEKAKKEFGFQPSVGLIEGLEMTYQWYVENQWL
ncbi:NAD-dependent epimerase/dehydratase family protein [bacterium]|nr:NAD-dependent epimerase/dehydratase family protein [bacterium]